MSSCNHMLKLLLLCSFCFLLFACSRVTQENYNKIKTEMTMDEVVNILGNPNSAQGIMVAGISGTSAMWKSKQSEIDIQFLNDKVAVKSFSKLDEKRST